MEGDPSESQRWFGSIKLVGCSVCFACWCSLLWIFLAGWKFDHWKCNYWKCNSWNCDHWKCEIWTIPIMDVPQDTIARVLQVAAFKDKKTRIESDVVDALQRYIDVFAREAVLRSIEHHDASQEGLEQEQDKEITHTDLENIAGLLLLDM
ncbi:hypothetical protein B1J92_I03432g [Nakaseomyces glabratus]|nr:hypothetical protein B1J91_I03432g [Nakaseomyces glabratus]OXB49397.1 hypothetical protein B1J92_I03432g [Nakaseomyces glabratus]